MLHVLFTLDCGQRGIVALVIDQHLDPVASGEAGHESFPVLKNTTHQIVGDADVEGAAPTTGEDVDPEAHRLFFYLRLHRRTALRSS